MNLPSLIETKRDGGQWTPAQIREFITELVAGRLPDYQVAALLMAVCFRGLDAEELPALTLAMRDSGETLQFPDDPRPVVDKHSTGGVGDKVSLPLAPLLACLGFRVPMISGRALGLTGGTLDKLESIPGFSTRLSRAQIIEQVQSLGVAMAGQTEHMVPADRILYGLRDVTGTVPSVPLITASILSKKLAESLDALVLDVKFGRGAFMPTEAAGRQLAESLVTLARSVGVRTTALLTRMDAPLGRAIGNWLEVRESVECLAGGGPEDLRALVVASAAQLLVLTGRADSVSAGEAQAAACLASGTALAKWEQLLVAQGADMARYHALLQEDSSAAVVREIPSPAAGFVSGCDARIFGEVLRDHGAGRLDRNSVIRAEVGVDRLVKLGEPVRRGEPLFRVHAGSSKEAEEMGGRLQRACTVATEAPSSSRLVVTTV